MPSRIPDSRPRLIVTVVSLLPGESATTVRSRRLVVAPVRLVEVLVELFQSLDRPVVVVGGRKLVLELTAEPPVLRDDVAVVPEAVPPIVDGPEERIGRIGDGLHDTVRPPPGGTDRTGVRRCAGRAWRA